MNSNIHTQAELIYNPNSGQMVLRRELNEVVLFLSRHGWHVTYRETQEAGQATQLTRQAVLNGAQVVIAAGGDGTINEVVNGLVNTNVSLGVLPVGTTNVWALQMGIPALNPVHPETPVIKLIAYRKLLLDAARVLVEGRTVAVDVGYISGRYFLMWAGIGLDAKILESVSPQEKKTLGSWAYMFNAIGLTSRATGSDISLEMDGEKVNTKSPLVIVSNIQLYGGIMAIGAKALLNDGKLDVCIFKGNGFFTFVQHAINVLSHRHLNDPKVEYYQCSKITLESSLPLPVHTDAERFTETPVTIQTLPSSLKVIASWNIPGTLFL